ncbi:MAG: succinylglutamate-semialdehyde dehydrogenase [Acidimicrobiales bacterium]
MNGLLINGMWDAGHGPVLNSISPHDGQIFWTGNEASAAQVEAAVEAAAGAFADWAFTPAEDRLAIVNRFAELVDERRSQLADLISLEVGKARWDAAGEVGSMVGKAALSAKAYRERAGLTDNGQLRVEHRPLGVLVVLGPFNFPGHLANGHIMPALLAGNTIVFKPSEQAPAFGEAMVELWALAGAPAGVINLVQGGATVGNALVNNSAVRGVLFTGGVAAGRAIHRSLAGRPEVQLALELGGNNPLIAFNVGDREEAARIIVRSAFVSAGQRCTCARRLITNDQALVDRVVQITRELTVGDPLATDQPFMGPVISAPAARAVVAAQERLVADGGIVLQPASQPSGDSAYVSPSVIDVTTVTHRPDEEVFGPLLQVIMVDSIDDAIAEANDTAFGLVAGLVSHDAALWDYVRPRLRAGIVNWNKPTVGASGAAPFGGIGISGNHRPAGYAASDYCSFPVASLMAPDVKDDGPLHGADHERKA